MTRRFFFVSPHVETAAVNQNKSIQEMLPIRVLHEVPAGEAWFGEEIGDRVDLDGNTLSITRRIRIIHKIDLRERP